MSSSARRLVLWDVDGTLVHTAGYGRDAFAEAFDSVFGHRPAREDLAMAGRTDHEIALGLLELNGIAGGEAHLPEFSAALAAALVAKEPEIRAEGHALPGAGAVLAALAERDGVVQSLLTGNIEPNAAVKLAAFGLGAELDFEIGAYGSDHRVRPELVAIARRRARERRGLDFAPAEVVLVGDTPLDVAAARGGGAAVVGVATGPSTAAELAGAGADAVLADLSDTADAVEAILGVSPRRSPP